MSVLSLNTLQGLLWFCSVCSLLVLLWEWIGGITFPGFMSLSLVQSRPTKSNPSPDSKQAQAKPATTRSHAIPFATSNDNCYHVATLQNHVNDAAIKFEHGCI